MSRSQTFIIKAPDVWINANERLHWRTRADRTRVWRNAAAWHVRAYGSPWQVDRVQIDATLFFAENRRRDVGNYYPTVKALVDGLVDAAWLIDDSDEYVAGPFLHAGQQPADRGAWFVGVHITLTELPANRSEETNQAGTARSGAPGAVGLVEGRLDADRGATAHGVEPATGGAA